MTAPADPRTIIHCDGSKVRVRWQPVEGATDYDLYIEEDWGTPGIEAQFSDLDLGSDGWFRYQFYCEAAQVVTVYVKAINALAEASDGANYRNLFLS